MGCSKWHVVDTVVTLTPVKSYFESLPDCIKDVAGFGESRRLAIGSLYCSTFKPSNYSYVHSSGPIGYGVSIDHLRGMAGILQFQKHIGDITVPMTEKPF